jgi:hypothetical protein
MQTIEQATPEQLAKRKANLERKQRQRAREKARSFQAMQAHARDGWGALRPGTSPGGGRLEHVWADISAYRGSQSR